ncbi:cobalamin B12-binding domain-containing protein [Micromonospora cathayae]|uniref:Cobalamin-dependent protein n=1 Tax=Micromonospora cathayae TaxID=3028804 RepID=A0ABY7ZKJ1_9ACTN|nr:cobalamin-dependent protein [Micromonospora sp. HUAS 3]WDZ83430.1 cobalamin-dependent protein [Micromonospora sp. HUAS 3]
MALSQSARKVLLTGTVSDSHTWNLVFLELFLTEQGLDVVNLGPCVPEDLLVRRCREHTPDLVVVSSVNGHGYADGLAAIVRLRAEPELADLPVVIGGKLGVDGRDDADRVARLRAAGYDAVFDDGDLLAFERFLTDLAAEPSTPVGRPA